MSLIKAGADKFLRDLNLLHEISFQNVYQYDHVRVFGKNPDVDATPNEDIWDLGGAYTYLDAAGEAISVASDNINDTDGGSGAEAVTVIGLTAAGVVQRVSVALNGQTEVALGTFRRVFSVRVDGSQTNTGVIYVGNGTFTAGVPANKFAAILAGNGVSHMAMFTIPSNMVGSLIKWNACLHGVGTKNAELMLKYRPSGGIFTDASMCQLSQDAYVRVDEYFEPGDYLPALTDIALIADSASADLVIHGGYIVLLKTPIIPSAAATKGFGL